MKRLLKLLALCLVPLLATSCYNKYYDEVSALNLRVDTLKQRLIVMKGQTETLSSLLSLYNSYYYVSDYTPIITSGDTTAYKITFSNGKSITVQMGTDGADAANGTTPILGVRMYTDGYYYWTVTYNGVTSYIYDSSTHLKVRAGAVNGTDGINGANGQQGDKGAAGKDATDGITPQLTITNGYWYLSVDGGKNWTYLGQATGDPGTSYFKSVTTDSNNYVVFTLIDGSVLKFPSEAMWSKISGYLDNINSSIALAKKAIEKLDTMDYIVSVADKVENGDTTHTVSFKKGTVLTLTNGKNGADAPAFTVSTKKDSDGKYYWTKVIGKDTTYLLDVSGQKILVYGAQGDTATVPIVTPKADTTGYYYWAVSVNGGESEYILDASGKKIMCQGLSGDAWVSSIDTTTSKNYVTFTLTGGAKVVFPTWKYHLEVMAAADSTNIRSAALKELMDEMYRDSVMFVKSVFKMSGWSIVGTSLYFSDGKVISVSNGSNSPTDSLSVWTPVVSAVLDTTDHKYYWSVKYGSQKATYLLDANGNKLLAVGTDATDGTYPIVGTVTVSGSEYWVIKVGTASYFITDANGNRIPVTATDGKNSTDLSLLKSITSDDYFTYFTLADNTVMKFLTYKTFNVTLGTYQTTFSAGSSTTVPITIDGAYSTPQVEFISETFKVTVSALSQDSTTKAYSATLTVSSTVAATGQVTLFVTDGMNKLVTKKLSFKAN
jgi:hypothetical protein